MRGQGAGEIDVEGLEGTRLRLRLMRVGLPIVGVVVVIGALLGIAAYSYVSNKRDALILAEEVMIAQEKRVRTEVAGFLAPPERAVDLLTNVVGAEGFRGDRRPIAEIFAMRLLRKLPQVAIISFADTAGNYMMVRRSPTDTLDTKIMEREGGRLRTTWTYRDAKDAVVRTAEDPSDTYDPRTRPWYTGAVENNFLSWSDIYVFHTDHVVGISISQPVYDDQHRIVGVYAVDMTLDSLGTFLGGLEIGKAGRAMIVDGQGRVIAHPEPGRATRKVGESVAPTRLDELDDPLLTRVFNIFRVEGRGRRVVEIDGDGVRYVTSVMPLYADDEAGWSVLIVVPENDFVGFVALNNRSVLLMSFGVALLVALLALLLIRQGLRADRNAALVLARERAREAQSRAFADLAANAALFDPDRDEAAQALTRTVARAVDARRAGLWLLHGRGATLACEDCFDRDSDGHTAGTELRRADMPALFEALATGDELEVADASRDRRTAELARHYLAAVGSRALISVPVVSAGRTVGAVWLEDAKADGARSFARAVANMVAVRVGAAARRAEVAPRAEAPPLRAAVGGDGIPGAAPAALHGAALALDRTARFAERVASLGVREGGLAATLFRDVTALSLQFTDSIALAEAASGEGGGATLDRFARALEEIAAACGIDYVKLVGHEAVLAAGFGGDAPAHAAAVAEAALALQEVGARLFSDLGRRLEFRIGIDTGTAIGSPIGAGAPAYNLWGETTRLAAALADTAPRGAIQVSEATYVHLRERYLFRARGGFYLDRVGEVPTFLLTGRT